MTVLSVNVNKIALLRNSRGRDFPNVVDFAGQVIDMGVKGITVHPRPDQRHITRQDIFDLSDFLKSKEEVEFNIEGYPSNDFVELVLEVMPAQCTLVPDQPGQLTSDHGWNVSNNETFLDSVLNRLSNAGVRSSLFMDADASSLEKVKEIGADRVELYTEKFASDFGASKQEETFQQYLVAAARAAELGIGLNAGHDLDLRNLPKFLTIPGILEVSIGHALVVESLQQGIEPVIKKYLDICSGTDF
ncbi:MAG: pyridoxine 5-phosphate synthase [Pseudohongiellaceae bacterium]|jgi:pyridoxine 5-phosphate synthase